MRANHNTKPEPPAGSPVWWNGEWWCSNGWHTDFHPLYRQNLSSAKWVDMYGAISIPYLNVDDDMEMAIWLKEPGYSTTEPG